MPLLLCFAWKKSEDPTNGIIEGYDTKREKLDFDDEKPGDSQI